MSKTDREIPAVQDEAIRPTADLLLDHNKPLLFAALSAVSAHSAIIEYSGFGDDGCVNDIQIYDKNSAVLNPDFGVTVMDSKVVFRDGAWTNEVNQTEMDLYDALSAFVDRAIDLYYAGFENGEGGYGHVAFYVDSRRVEMKHSDAFVVHQFEARDL